MVEFVHLIVFQLLCPCGVANTSSLTFGFLLSCTNFPEGQEIDNSYDAFSASIYQCPAFNRLPRAIKLLFMLSYHSFAQ